MSSKKIILYIYIYIFVSIITKATKLEWKYHIQNELSFKIFFIKLQYKIINHQNSCVFLVLLEEPKFKYSLPTYIKREKKKKGTI